MTRSYKSIAQFCAITDYFLKLYKNLKIIILTKKRNPLIKLDPPPFSNTFGNSPLSNYPYTQSLPFLCSMKPCGSCCLFFSFLCCVICTIVFLFVFFIFSHGVVSLFQIYEFDCPFDIFRLSFCSTISERSIHLNTSYYLETRYMLVFGPFLAPSSCMNGAITHKINPTLPFQLTWPEGPSELFSPLGVRRPSSSSSGVVRRRR